jgi:hypothetical protein
MGFKDHFSRQSAAYRQFRPGYPPELFAYLASIAPGRALAWDCATGNGQAAIGLAPHFTLVVVTGIRSAVIRWKDCGPSSRYLGPMQRQGA